MPSVHQKLPLDIPYQGLRPDVDDFHIPPDALRSTSFNWILRDGKIVTRPGLTLFGQDTGTALPTGIISYYDHNGIWRLVHSTTTNWWYYNLSTQLWEDITSGAPWSGFFSRASFRVFNSGGIAYLLGVNGINTPRAWDSNPANNFDVFSGSAPGALCIAIVADRVLLGNLTGGAGGSVTVDTSAFQDHTSGWGVTQTTVLVDTPGAIISMNELGASRTAIYKTDAVYLASGTTGLAPVRYDLHSAYVPGPASSHAVVPLASGLHAIFTGQGELFTFDGVNYSKHPASDRVRILYNRDASFSSGAIRQIHGFYDHLHSELWYFYSRTGIGGTGCRDAIVINLVNNSVWKINFNKSGLTFTASHYGDFLTTTTTKTLPMLARNTAQLYTLEGQTDSGFSLDTLMESGLNPLGDPTRLKTVEETEHFFASPGSQQTPSVRILTNNAGGSVGQSAAQTLTLNPTSDGPYTTGHRNSNGEKVSSRFLGLRIEDTDLTGTLEYRGSAITVVPRGTR